jgi:hypothetical protein
MQRIQWVFNIFFVSLKNTLVFSEVFVPRPFFRSSAMARKKSSLSGNKMRMIAAKADIPAAHQNSVLQLSVSSTSVKLITAANKSPTA